MNHYLFLCFTLSSGGERNERGRERWYRNGREKKGARVQEGERERGRKSEGKRMLRRAARSSNYYGFSGSNSPDGNTTQFTHADCAREDVNSCQSDGPFHLLFFAVAPNRHRGRSRTIIRFSTFSSPVLRPPISRPPHSVFHVVSRPRASARCFVAFDHHFTYLEHVSRS